MDAEQLREGAIRVGRRLIDAGFEAYFAGGCVRDHILGKEPKDWDIATNARPEQVQALFKRTLAVGAAFGVVEVIEAKGRSYEVATYRADGEYSDGRRPDEVHYSESRIEDVVRRDFTINALLMHPISFEVEDYVGGEADLRKSILRAVGDARTRFREDRLRMLRAVRFSSRLGFAIEALTWEAMVAEAAHLPVVSPERITAELEQIMVGPNPSYGFELIVGAGLEAALPEVQPKSWSKLWEAFLAAKPTLDGEQQAIVAWALFHAALEPSQLEAAVRARKLSKAVLRGVQQMKEDLQLFIGTAPEGARLSVAQSARAPMLGVYFEALDGGAKKRLDQALRFLDQHPPVLEARLTGMDLQSLGLKPGPDFKRILTSVEHEILLGSIRDKDSALALARSLAKSV